MMMLLVIGAVVVLLGGIIGISQLGGKKSKPKSQAVAPAAQAPAPQSAAPAAAPGSSEAKELYTRMFRHAKKAQSGPAAEQKANAKQALVLIGQLEQQYPDYKAKQRNNTKRLMQMFAQ